MKCYQSIVMVEVHGKKGASMRLSTPLLQQYNDGGIAHVAPIFSRFSGVAGMQSPE